MNATDRTAQFSVQSISWLLAVGLVPMAASAQEDGAETPQPEASQPETSPPQSEAPAPKLGGIIPVGYGEKPASAANALPASATDSGSGAAVAEAAFELEPIPLPDKLVRVRTHKVPMRCFATEVSPNYGELFAQGSVVEPVATLDEFTRVRMPEGALGYVHSKFTTAPDLAGRVRTKGTGVAFRFESQSGRAPVTRLDPSTPLLVVGEQDGWWRVRYREAPVWVKSDLLEPVVDRKVGEAAWNHLADQLRAGNVEFARAVAAREEEVAAAKARAEQLQSVSARYSVESRKPAKEQKYKPLMAEVDAILTEIDESTSEHGALVKLRASMEQSAKIAEAARLLDVEDAPPPAPVIEPVDPKGGVDPLDRFDAMGWLTVRRVGDKLEYALQKGQLEKVVVQCTSGRYDLAQFVGLEVGVNGTAFRAHLSSLRTLDIKSVEILGTLRTRR